MDLEQRLARGMKLIPRLPDLTTNEIGEDRRPLYSDIEQTLRVPFVNFLPRMLANFPSYFQPAWNGLAPHLRTLEFERAADRLRAAAAEKLTVDPIDLNSLDRKDWRAVVDFTDSIHYVLPKLLLIATVFDLQLDGLAASRVSVGGTGNTIDYEIAEGTRVLQLVDPARASERVHEIFEDIRRTHGHPGVASYYRGLANFPVFLDTVWTRVRSYIGTGAYQQRKQAVLTFAEELVLDRLPSESKIPDSPDQEDIGAILAVFRYRVIPDLLLDLTLIKLMLDGREAAQRSRFSVA